MKRFLVLLLTLVMCLHLSACGGSKPQDDGQTVVDDLAYVQEKGTLVVGITDFAPMDFQNENGDWIGFDADMATAFAESLGVSVEFKVIDWSSKVIELNDKNIDVVWNGMTLSDDIKAAMSTSKPYFNNAQVVIVKADAAEKYQTADSLTGAAFAVESHSAGQEQADIYEFNYTVVSDQTTALQNVSSGESDAAIIDFLMAIAMIGEGKDYADLTYTVSLSDEEYGVGFRSGSNLVDALNDFFVESYISGAMQSIARNYGISAFLLAQ